MVKKLLEPFKEVVNMVKCILGELFMQLILFLENFPARMMCYIYLGVEKSITRKNMKFWFRMKKQGMPGFLHQRAKFHKKQFQVKRFMSGFCRRRSADDFFLNIPAVSVFTFYLFWVKTPLSQHRPALMLCSKMEIYITHENE